jgi:hypothetical protein
MRDPKRRSFTGRDGATYHLRLSRGVWADSAGARALHYLHFADAEGREIGHVLLDRDLVLADLPETDLEKLLQQLKEGEG